jgi:hypothetical protein
MVNPWHCLCHNAHIRPVLLLVSISSILVVEGNKTYWVTSLKLQGQNLNEKPGFLTCTQGSLHLLCDFFLHLGSSGLLFLHVGQVTVIIPGK